MWLKSKTKTYTKIMRIQMQIPVMLAVAAVVTVAFTTNLSAADVDLAKIPPASDKTGLTYEKDIKPIFEKSCFKCHGPEKQKGKMRADSLEAVLKGGENGKSIEPGKPEKSPVLASISRLNPDEAMPPEDKGEPLTKEQVGLIRAWITQGAK